MEGQRIPLVFSAAGAGLSHASGLSKGSRENGGQGDSSLAGLNWKFMGVNGTLIPFDFCQGYILVAPGFGSILVDVPNVQGAVQTQPRKPASAGQEIEVDLPDPS